MTTLAQDRGWIGQALSHIPNDLLQEADRWAEFNADSLRKHNDPKRLPLPDPWQCLLDMPVIGDLGKKICSAAQSQLVALRQLCRMATGVATSESDWQQRAVKAAAEGDQRQSEHAANKVAAALWRFEAAQAILRGYGGKDPARRAKAQEWQERRRAQLVHRGKRSEAGESKRLPRWKEIQAHLSLETRLAFGWVRLRPDGPPGFMFWRNEALRKVIPVLRRGAQTPLKNLGRDYMKNLRQNLGLIPVNAAACTVWDVTVRSRVEGGWLVTGRERSGKRIFDEPFPATEGPRPSR